MPGYTPTSKLLVSEGETEIYADAIGDPTLPAIVFIHGFGLSCICFDAIFSDPTWLDRVCLIRYDRRGYGRSGKPMLKEAYQSKREAEDFLAVVNAFGVKKAFLAGWSMGTAVAADVCTYSGPTLLHGIISLAGVPYMALVGNMLSDFVKTLWPGMTGTDDVALAIKTASDFVDCLVMRPDAVPYRQKMAWLGEAMSMPLAIRTHIMAAEQDPTAFITEAGAVLHHLLLQGSEDKTRGNVEILENELHRIFGERSTVVFFAGVGHAFFVEIPDKVRDTVLQWVSTIL